MWKDTLEDSYRITLPVSGGTQEGRGRDIVKVKGGEE